MADRLAQMSVPVTSQNRRSVSLIRSPHSATFRWITYHLLTAVPPMVPRAARILIGVPGCTSGK